MYHYWTRQIKMDPNIDILRLNPSTVVEASINIHSQSTQRVCLTWLNDSHATSHHEKLTSWKIICGKGKKRFPLRQTLVAQLSAQMFMGPVWVRLVRQGALVCRRARPRH